MATVTAKPFTSKDLSGFGSLLQSYLSSKYPSLLNVTTDFTATTWSKDVTAAIEDAFKSLKLLTGSATTIDSLKTIELSSGFREGDVLISTTANGHIYLITSVSDSYIGTFPLLSSDDSKLVNTMFPTPMKIKRIENLSDKINQTTYQTFATKVISESIKTINFDNSYFEGSHIPIDSTHLQVGDLVFSVDPVQISFTTQNGYQIFPTIRSDGNPKISTGQQIKNISVSLIFPNIDAINYQLIPLYAMYRRTPFVNIRNREITRFFFDLIAEESLGWVPVALESINIQSIDGFPNSLQADISFLPLDASTLGNKCLKALKSINDVIIQQDLHSRDREQDRINDILSNKLSLKSTTDKTSRDLIDYVIESSEDFRESVPFRSFYQSLISDRNEVLDEHGKVAPVINNGHKTDIVTRQISEFAPRRDENKLKTYKAEHNNSPVSLRYKYIPKNYIDVAKDISKNRRNLTQEKIDRVKSYLSTIKNGRDLAQVVVPIFLTDEDLTRQYSYIYSQADNILNRAFVEYGLDVSVDSKLYSPMSFILRSLFNNTSLSALWMDRSNISKAANSIDKTSSVRNWIFGAGIVYSNSAANSSQYSGVGFKSIEAAFEEIYQNAAAEGKLKAVLDVLDKIAIDITHIVTGAGTSDTVLLTDGLGGVDETGYTVERLPIQTETINIDNEFDVITNWSVSFANKFVPFYLQLSKYPFYQHLGFEDATLTLRIISVPRANKYDLKAQLSKMSDRVAESSKIVNFSAPELSALLDPRVTIESKPNSIFNALGIRNVVLNSSNTTNVQGKPDSWNTVINFTQAKFTVEQYHSIESKPNISPIETLVANLILRLKNDPKEGLIIKKYYADNVPDPKPEDLLFMSFVDSDAGTDFNNYLISLYSGGKFIETNNAALQSRITESKQILDRTIPGWQDVDATATGALRSIVSSNSQIEKILKEIVKSYAAILQQQSELYKELITPKKNIWQSFLTTIGLNKDGDNRNAKFLIYFALLANTIRNVFGTVIGAGAFLGIGAGVLTEVSREQGFQYVKEKGSDILATMGDVIKRQVTIELAHGIAKDPIIRDKLLSPEILYGDRGALPGVSNILAKFKDLETEWKNFNCYSDFDIPPTVGTKDGRLVYVAPDFYLAINNISKATINAYLESAMDGIGRTNQMSMELAMLSSVDVKLRLDNILGYITEGNSKGALSPELMIKLKDHFNFKGTLNDVLKDSVTKYIQLVKTGTVPEGPEGQAAPTKVISASEQKKIKAILDEALKDKNISKKDKTVAKQLVDDLLLGTNTPFQNEDAFKFNFIVGQRDIVLMEIMELFYAINAYLNSAGLFQGESKASKTAAVDKFLQFFGESYQINLDSATKSAIIKMKDDIGQVLNKFNEINSNNIPKELQKNYNKGMSVQRNDNKADALSIPQMRILQNLVYNKIGYYIRLNTAIEESNKTLPGEVNLDTLPELRFLEYFNRREFESGFRKLKITKEFEESANRQYELNSRMFPTFKVLFIEEDGRTSLLDDYYSYNAIQSIEIVKNKNFASSTAVIRLSNATGALTDRLTFHRETRDYLNTNASLNNDEAFFGTLNVKPGTRVLIKIGYGTGDTQLPTVFSGRILEMNVGPVTEMICQSFGAQLKQELFAEDFGFVAGINRHGDIASALLDKIPGLENFGSKELFRATILGKTSGKNFKNIRRNIFDRFVMSNIIGRINNSNFTSDNPRDENIYLPYDISPIIRWTPTFTWKVYQQSVWDALKELCLYNSNVDMVIRPYNNDGISTRSEQRETLIIGGKSGYYKCTDAYGFSSIDYADVDNRLEKFKDIVGKLKNVKIITKKTEFFNAGGPAFSGTTNYLSKVSEVTKKINNNEVIVAPEWKNTWDFFNDRKNYLIITKYLMNTINVSNKQAKDFVADYIKMPLQRLGIRSSSTPEELLTEAMFRFQSTKMEKSENLLNGNLDKLNAFEDMLIQAGKLYAKNTAIWDSISKEQFYDIIDLPDNYNEQLISNVQYKKIQKHHLVSDSYNLLNNNIILNGNFANMVNLYYFDNPVMIDEKGLTPDKLKKINVWSTKAFRDIKDEYLRPINSFQKNIDTSWFDIVKTEEAIKGYGKINLNDKSLIPGSVKSNVEAELVKKLKLNGVVNLDLPDWKAFPSYMLVGVNLLKREVQQMYRGTLQIIGDPKIEPMDIVHIDDLMSDMQGAVEVEEVVHTFTPEQGFVTTITPSLIVYDRDPQQVEDTAIVNRVFSDITTNKRVNIGKAAVGTAAALGGLAALFTPHKVIGAGSIMLGTPLAFSGINGMTTGYHRFLHDTMMEIMGGDVINFTALIYKGMPFMSGFEGVDYTNLKTLINHKVAGIKGLVTRFTAFADPYQAWLRTGFEPDEVSWLHLVPGVRQLVTLRNNGTANESIGFFDVLFKGLNPFEIKP